MIPLVIYLVGMILMFAIVSFLLGFVGDDLLDEIGLLTAYWGGLWWRNKTTKNDPCDL